MQYRKSDKNVNEKLKLRMPLTLVKMPKVSWHMPYSLWHFWGCCWHYVEICKFSINLFLSDFFIFIIFFNFKSAPDKYRLLLNNFGALYIKLSEKNLIKLRKVKDEKMKYIRNKFLKSAPKKIACLLYFVRALYF